MTWAMLAASVVGLGWALAWWDVRRRQSASLRASELEGFHVKLGALEKELRASVSASDEVLRDLAKQFGSMKLAVGMSPGARMKGVRERFAEAESRE